MPTFAYYLKHHRLKISREVKTGIVVLAGIIAFMVGFNYLKSSPLFNNSKTFYAIYNNVGGLQPGTEVSINGLAVGAVKTIRFKDQSGQLIVTFSVDNGFAFSKNSIAELYDTGIIGGKGLQVQPVFDGAANAQSGDTLPARSKPGLTELVQQNLAPLQNKVEGAVAQADSLLVNVNEVLDEPTKQKLQQTIVALHRLVHTATNSVNNVTQLLENNTVPLNRSLKNIDHITSNLSTLTDSLAHSGLSQTLAQLQSSTQHLNTFMATLQSGKGTLGKLTQDDALYIHLTQAARELELLLQDLRLNPKRYVNVSVFGKKQKKYFLPKDDPAEQNPQ